VKENSIYKESIIFFFISIIATITGVLSTLILVRMFSVSDFGKFQGMLALYGVLNVFLLQGLNIFIQKSIIEKHYGFLRYVYRFLTLYLIPVSLSIFLVLYYIFPIYEDIIFFSVLIMLIFALFDRTEPIVSGLKKFFVMRAMLLARQFVYLGFVVYFYFNDMAINKFIIFYLLLAVFFSTLSFLIGRYYVQGLPTCDESSLNKVKLSKALINSLASSWGLVATWIDRIILTFFSLEALAFLHVAQIIPKTLKDNAKSLFFVPVNTWVTFGEKYTYGKIWKYKYKIFGIGLLMTMLLIFFGVFIIDLAFGDKYNTVYLYLLFFSSTLGFQFVSFFIHSAATLGNDIQMFNRVLLLGPSIKIISAIILVPTLKLDGAVISNMMGEIIVYIYTINFFLRKTKELGLR
jgi:O-antigen/teichoic acid export membrane protein